MPLADFDISKVDPVVPVLRERTEPPVYWFDVGDLANFLAEGTSPTGIQRVMLEIVSNIDPARRTRGDFGFCRSDGRKAQLSPAVLPGIFPGLESPIQKNGSREMHWLNRCLGLSKPEATPAKAGDVLICLGLPWFVRGHNQKIARIKAEWGIKVALFIHDLIPLAHPNFVTRSVFKAFSNWIDGAIANTDLLLVQSDYTARSLRHMAEKRGWRLPPMERLRFGSRPLAQPLMPVQENVAESRRSPGFVLYVATFERRKNHRLLFEIWRSLLSKHGASAIPDLVLAGRRLGQMDKVFDRAMRHSKALDGKIHVLKTVNDGSLRALYSRCEFTVFPSLVEGWGLPVAESLSYGKLCLASSRTSIPEVAGDLVPYFDPDDLPGAIELVERAIFDQAWRGSQEERIRTGFNPPSWSACARTFTNILDTRFANGGAEP